MVSYYLGSGRFRITGRFGENRGDHIHQGVDFAAPIGTPIQSLIGGTVVRKGYQAGGAGYYVVIRGADGTETKYFHMKGASPLKVGEKVAPGSIIGFVGNTGHSTGSHLHLEVWQNGKAIDPLGYLKGLSSGRYQPMPGMFQIRGLALSQAPRLIQEYISLANQQYKVKPQLIAAVIKAESGFNYNAKSPAGAYGLMQLMPGFGSGRLDPKQNVMMGTKFLRDLLLKYNDVRLALAAYNWGPGNVDKALKRYGRDWSTLLPHLPRETQKYVDRVLSYL